MKKIVLALFLAAIGFVANAQTTATPVKYPIIDPSPLDVVYYPLNAAKVKKGDQAMPIIKVVYSRPAKKGREIFGVLEQFDKVWRLGANENTEISFARTVTIGDKKIKAGTYSLFAIPTKNNWTIILNKQTDRWGAFSYDQANDVTRIVVPLTKTDKVVENFSITFAESTEGANLFMAWDTTQVMLPILFKK